MTNPADRAATPNTLKVAALAALGPDCDNTTGALYTIAAAIASLAEQQEATAKAQADTARALERIAEGMQPVGLIRYVTQPVSPSPKPPAGR